MCHVGETEAQKLIIFWQHSEKIKNKEEQNTPSLEFGGTLIELSLSSCDVSDDDEGGGGGRRDCRSCLLHVHPHCDHVSHYAFLWGGGGGGHGGSVVSGWGEVRWCWIPTYVCSLGRNSVCGGSLYTSLCDMCLTFIQLSVHYIPIGVSVAYFSLNSFGFFILIVLFLIEH